MRVRFLQFKHFGYIFQLSEGLDEVLYMAEYNFLRGYNVHYERTLSLVTFGYQEVAAYIESVLLQANNISTSDDVMRTALYVSATKETRRIEVIIDLYLPCIWNDIVNKMERRHREQNRQTEILDRNG